MQRLQRAWDRQLFKQGTTLADRPPNFTKAQADYLNAMIPLRLIREGESVESYRTYVGSRHIVDFVVDNCAELRLEDTSISGDDEDALVAEIEREVLEEDNGVGE